ncbi:MAG TPA: hypothetical protein VHF50_02390 [Solirubrobacterales bacterium]|nr:hypothetical protein [Solirubrobacterales bacterium]
MDFLEGLGLVLGIGIAVGMLAGTTGTHGSARGRMTLLAAVIGFVAGFLLADSADLSSLAAAIFCLIGAAVACVVISDVVGGAGRREGSRSGALAFLVSLAALVITAIAVLVEPLTLLVLAGLVWLGLARHRRAQRKHAGLRILR